MSFMLFYIYKLIQKLILPADISNSINYKFSSINYQLAYESLFAKQSL